MASTIQVLELVDVSDKSFRDAVENALAEASETVRRIRGIDVVPTTAEVENEERVL